MTLLEIPVIRENILTICFKYCGEYKDSSLGGIYLRARIYNPGTGRFATEDPARDGMNWYVYCGNNPVMFIDPTGKSPGDLFSNPDMAARDFGLYINNKSINDNKDNAADEKGREYGAYMYELEAYGKKFYSYFEPIRGEKSSVSIYAPSEKTDEMKIFAILHTHAGYSEKYSNDIFSDTDKNYAKESQYGSILAYVATPLGILRKYDPKTEKDNVISEYMPYDSNHIDIKNRNNMMKIFYDYGVSTERLIVLMDNLNCLEYILSNIKK